MRLPSSRVMVGRGPSDSRFGPAFGEVRVKLTLKKQILGQGFLAAGAAPEDPVAIFIKLEIGDKTIEVAVPTEFNLSNNGIKGSGTGETE